MAFNWTRKRSMPVVNGPISGNEDRLASDASLKAAQAIFKKHEAPVVRNDSPSYAPVKSQQRRATRSRQQTPNVVQKPKAVIAVPHPRPCKKVLPPGKSASKSTLTAAQAAAATAQKSIITVEPQNKSKATRLSRFWGSPSNESKTPPVTLPHRSSSVSDSLHSHVSTKSSQTDDFADIVAQLQGSKDNLAPYKNGRHGISGSLSPRANTSTDSVISLNTSSDDVNRLPSKSGQSGPPLLSRQTTRNGKGVVGSQLSELENSSSGRPQESPVFLSAKAMSSRTLTAKRPLPQGQTKEESDDNISISSMQSSAFSGLPSAGVEPSSDQEFSEFSVSPRVDSYRHELARSSIDQSSGIADANSDRLSCDTLPKRPPHIRNHSTLPDLIPNHQRDKKKGRLSSIFGRKNKSGEPDNTSSSNGAATENGAVAKNNQPIRLKTTMRTNSNNYEESGPEESSDEYESGSENDDFNGTGKKKKSKRSRVRIRKHIKKASGHTNSQKKGFNEDKPWKSHIDIGFVTQAERKRYEGMWVTNRNCYLELLPWWEEDHVREEYVPDEGLILNLVVLAIWSRSNLPQDKLATIYDMVDTRCDGTLERKSFIVGMWLVDQSLYGRKLPSKIQPRVWESVDRFIINVPNEAQLGLKRKDKQKQMKQEMKTLKKELKRAQL
ncbi:LANO_0F05622g1_1 [Lachancea nothofagi CBS 11611]|uniref:LANO_0F05622g1_1 n=1 Tax=Lachancea nothofagi CBS 11611 TaxID=1266666 RepID=A0A1G4K890_9SACH|nr:LANO_0F05622g1_1 [Lachancea nothofagi CBS 11611]